MSKYRYSYLRPDKKQIRLLELRPGRYKQTLEGTLKTVNLEDRPTYEALSYTWAPITEENGISLGDNKILPISNNLERALRRLRRRFRKRVLWVDQICINQADLDERSTQVAFMGEIFSRSLACVVWIGDISNTSIAGESKLLRFQFVLCFLRWALWRYKYDRWNSWTPLAGKTFDDPVSYHLRSQYQVPSKRAFCYLLCDISLARPCHMSLAIAETSPAWIDRAWVRQEYLLGKVRWIHFGPYRLAPFRDKLDILRMWIHDISEYDELTCSRAPDWHRHCGRLVDGINITSIGGYRENFRVTRFQDRDLLGIVTF